MLTILCGISGTGKSTYAKELAAREKSFIICRDKIREMVYGEYKFIPENEEKINILTTEMVMQALKNKISIIIDETNITEKRRDNWRKIGLLCNSDVKLVYLYTDNNLIERRMTSPKGQSEEVWAKVIENQTKRFEIPTDQEIKMYQEYEEINIP